MDAELVFDGDATGVVARAERAVGIHQELGHQEQRNALHPGRRIGQAGEHEMDDVVRHVVVAVGDENLLAENAVAAIGLRLGAGADQRQVGAGLRLGQVHRAGPFAGDHLFQVDRLQLVAGADQQRLDSAGGEQRAERERQIGRAHHLLDGDGQGIRLAVAAEYSAGR